VIKAKCPSCQKAFWAKNQFSGKIIDCKYCQKKVPVSSNPKDIRVKQPCTLCNTSMIVKPEQAKSETLCTTCKEKVPPLPEKTPSSPKSSKKSKTPANLEKKEQKKKKEHKQKTALPVKTPKQALPSSSLFETIFADDIEKKPAEEDVFMHTQIGVTEDNVPLHYHQKELKSGTVFENSSVSLPFEKILNGTYKKGQKNNFDQTDIFDQTDLSLPSKPLPQKTPPPLNDTQRKVSTIQKTPPPLNDTQRKVSTIQKTPPPLNDTQRKVSTIQKTPLPLSDTQRKISTIQKTPLPLSESKKKNRL
jgi:hypothetical protein